MKTNNIIQDKKRTQLVRSKDREKYQEALRRGSFVTRRRLMNLDEAIAEAVREIEDTTGWEYFDNHFRSRSDFYYDKEKDQISFQVNLVERIGEEYYRTTATNEREVAFTKKNHFLLSGLAHLEARRDQLYDQTLDRPTKDTPVEDTFTTTWTDIEMSYFLEKYGEEGIRRLLKLLNQLTDSTCREDTYNAFIRDDTSRDFKNRVLSWVSVYLPQGGKWFNEFQKEKPKEYVKRAIEN